MLREKELISLLGKSLGGLTNKQLKKIVDRLKDLIINSVPKWEEGVHLKNFGTFKLIVSKSRQVRNVRKLEEMIIIPSKYLLKFYPSATVRKKFGSKPTRKRRKTI